MEEVYLWGLEMETNLRWRQIQPMDACSCWVSQGVRVSHSRQLSSHCPLVLFILQLKQLATALSEVTLSYRQTSPKEPVIYLQVDIRCVGSGVFVFAQSQIELEPSRPQTQCKKTTGLSGSSLSRQQLMLRGSSDFNQKSAKKLSPSEPLLKSTHQRAQFPKQLTSEIPFNPRDKGQTYYRAVEFTSSKHRSIKLGWKILELALEQVDLALYCFAILQNEANFPFRIYAAHQEAAEKVGNEIYQQIWVEWTVLQTSRTENTQGLEWGVYNICLGDFLPRVRSFVSKYMSWSYMSSKDYEDVKVVRKFKVEVIDPLKQKMANFRPLPNPA